MNLATFDLYGKKETKNHGLILYYDIFFNGKKLIYSNKISKNLNILNLTKELNKIDFRSCHNFNGYDGEKLPSLESHSERNIDTLLIDTLFYFDKSHHNLKKSIKNNPLEDAETTFNILEKNIIYFYNLGENIQNIIYSLLINYDEYNDFFIFYNKLINNKLKILNQREILEKLNIYLQEKGILEFNFDFNIFFKSNNQKLALSYILLFLETKKIVLPDFIYKNNNELKLILKENLPYIYEIFNIYFNKNIKKYLKNYYGFNNFRGEIQSLGVKYSLLNKDILTILSTGGGKSLIYQLPARIVGDEFGYLSLIVTPLKALIKDQIDGLRSKGFNEVSYFSGDQSNLEKEIIRNKIKSGETKILFLTPESLRNKNNLDLFKNRFISRIIVDEAHTLILWGGEFRPDYFFIKTFLEDLEKVNLNKKINITLLTATAPIDVENGLKTYFINRNFKIIKQENILKENIKPSVINIKNPKNKIEILINKIKEINIEINPTIIFTGNIGTTEELKNHLSEEGIKSEAFYGGRNKKGYKLSIYEKKTIQEKFISGDLNLIIATKAFGMGIDKENVRYVIHYDLPGNIEDYLQEIGRAGRDGKKSKNIIFYDKKDIEKRLNLLNISEIKSFNIINFIKYIKLSKNKNKITLSPRQIAKLSYIKTNKKNYITNVKILLNFLEREEIFNKKNILERKYDNTSVFLNKIEEYKINENYKKIENDKVLNKDEKELAKNIVEKIIEKKQAIDLNKLEENFNDIIGEDFNYKNISINKIINKIKSLKILGKLEKNEEQDLVIEAGNILKKENYLLEDDNKFEKIFNIYKKRVENIESYEEKNNASFYEKIKNYYLFKNFIKEQKNNIIIKNKYILEHFERNIVISKIILDNIFVNSNDLKNGKIIDIINLLQILQKKYKNNFGISELKEVLYFLHFLDIIKVRNGLLVLLTRFNLEFNQNIFELKNKLDNKEYKKNFEKRIKSKLDYFIEIKKQKLLALQLIVENLKLGKLRECNNLTKYYFSQSLKDFGDKFLIKKEINEYEKFILR